MTAIIIYPKSWFIFKYNKFVIVLMNSDRLARKALLPRYI